MPKRTNQFQSLIYNIEKSLANESTHVEESALVKDNLGIEREIDVLITTTINQIEIKLAVECRDYNRDQTISWIDELVGKYSNISVDKIIAVSSSGFSNTAKEKAEQNNIIAISLDEANKHEWSDFIEKIVIGLYRFEVSLLDAGAQLKRQSNEVLADNETLYDKSGKAISDSITELDKIYETHGRSIIHKELSQSGFFDNGLDKSCLVDMPLDLEPNLFVKGESGALYPIERVIYRLKCEVYFLKTNNEYHTYKDALVVKTTSKIEGKNVSTYGIPIQTNNGIDVKLFSNLPKWERKK